MAEVRGDFVSGRWRRFGVESFDWHRGVGQHAPVEGVGLAPHQTVY